jgi:hypothetical protein
VTDGEAKVRGLQKFVERGAYREGPGRAVYVLESNSLPQAAEGMSWQKVASFSAAEELLNNSGLKAVFKVAIEKGCALVTQKATGK